MRSFILAAMAAQAYAQTDGSDPVPTTISFEDLDSIDTTNEETNSQAIEMINQLMDLFCEESVADRDHDGDRDGDRDGEHHDHMDGEDHGDETSGDETSDDEEGDRDHESRKNRHFCRQARKMLNELQDYHSGDERHRRDKAEEWGGRMRDGAWELFGWSDGATNSLTGGVAILAAVLSLAYF